MALSVPTLSPGGSGALTITVSDPVNTTLSSVSLTFELYGWNTTDGSSGTLSGGDTWAPSISYSGGAGALSVNNIPLTNIAPGQSRNLQLNVVVPSGCPSATYFIRSSANITVSNGTEYHMLSRGYFSNAIWREATVLPDGAPTLNLTLLGVSGILPETAIQVSSGSSQSWIWIFLGVSLVLGGIGGYLWVRSSGSSRAKSGTSRSFRRKKAATALGNKRAREGD